MDGHRNNIFKNPAKELIMKEFKSLVSVASLALALAFAACNALAQPGFGGGGFGGGGGGVGGRNGFFAALTDPAQRAQMQVDSLRDSLAVTNDAEWNVIAARLMKVVQIKSDIAMAEVVRMMTPLMAMMPGGIGANMLGGGANPFGGAADPSADALQKALDNSAPSADVKAALAKFRESKKLKLAELTKAQDALKEVLSVRQEAALALAGYLE